MSLGSKIVAVAPLSGDRCQRSVHVGHVALHFTNCKGGGGFILLIHWSAAQTNRGLGSSIVWDVIGSRNGPSHSKIVRI